MLCSHGLGKGWQARVLHPWLQGKGLWGSGRLLLEGCVERQGVQLLGSEPWLACRVLLGRLSLPIQLRTGRPSVGLSRVIARVCAGCQTLLNLAIWQRRALAWQCCQRWRSTR